MSFDCFIAQKLDSIPKTENVIAIAVDQTTFTCICPLMPCVFLLGLDKFKLLPELQRCSTISQMSHFMTELGVPVQRIVKDGGDVK